MKVKIAYIIIFSLVVASCKKDESTISNIPAIEFISVTPASVKEYQDKLIFSISYTDGDGDLGENNSAVKNLFLTDSRNNVTYKYRIQQLAPDGASIAIKGNLSVELNNTGITDGSNSQTFTYSLYVIDRAGNQSNIVTTSPVVVTK
jgi:hypothetical protein